MSTWPFNNAKGSILAAMVFHAVGNTVAQMFSGSTSSVFYWVVLGLTVVLVVAVHGPRTLVRKERAPFQARGTPTLESQPAQYWSQLRSYPAWGMCSCRRRQAASANPGAENTRQSTWERWRYGSSICRSRTRAGTSIK